MDKICGIYKIISPSNKIYIGQSIDIYKRWNYHYKKLRCKAQSYLYNSFLKHGVNNHKFEIIYLCRPDELNKYEKYYIDIFQCFNSKNGLNLRDGGGSFGALSDATKIKISNSNRGRIISIETKEKISQANKGRKQSYNEIQKRIKKLTGKKRSNESRCKMSLSQKGIGLGKHHSIETKLKIKEALTGKKHSIEHINNFSIAINKKIKCNCDYCGNEKYEKKSVYLSKEKHFCNMNCYSLWMSKNNIGINATNYKHGRRIKRVI